MPSWFRLKGGAARPSGTSPEELFALARRYLVQEALGPLRRLAKGLGLGLAGAAAFGLGAVVALLGVLRVLETETGRTFFGNWSFAPYLITAACGAGVIGASLLVGLHALRADRSRD